MNKLPVILLLVWLIGWPISSGYFTNRPWCNKGSPQDPVACGVVTGVLWPFTVLASVSGRIFR